jgi:hypothetical protein
MTMFSGMKSALIVTALSMLGPAAALADEPSGTAIAVIQSTQAAGAAGSRVLQDQGPVYSGDKIVTGASGQAQIKFRDDTKLVVGPNSSLTIDAFVYSGKSAKEVSIDAVKGAFRFITGVSKKDAYSISTPTAVIAVRGTEFDFHVNRSDGETEVVMLGGATLICPKTLPNGSPNTKGQGCVEAKLSCGMTIIPTGGDDLTQLKASEERNGLINRDFRYIRDQGGLNADFRLNVAQCGNAAGIINIPVTTPNGSAPNAQGASSGEGGGGD